MTRRTNSFGKRGGGGRRSRERESVGIPALVVSLSQRHQAILIELSTTGARVRVADPPKKFSEVFLAVEQLSIYAKIAWRSGEVCGLTFAHEIDAYDVELVRRKANFPDRSRITPQQKGGAADWRNGLAR